MSSCASNWPGNLLRGKREGGEREGGKREREGREREGRDLT